MIEDLLEEKNNFNITKHTTRNYYIYIINNKNLVIKFTYNSHNY